MKLDFRTKMSYGLAGVGDSAFYNLAGTFLLFFLSTVVGLDPAVAGLITAVGSVWETVCGAVIGYMSDNTISRYGKRKPYLLAAAFPLAVFTTLLFTTIDAGDGPRALYYGAMVILFWTAFAAFFVPYLAWGAELTQNYDERTVLRGYTFLFNNVGAVIGMVLPAVIVDMLMRLGGSEAFSWQIMALLCGLCGALTIFCGAFNIHDRFEREYRGRGKTAKRRPSFKDILSSGRDMMRNYREILNLRAIRFILAASIMYLIAYAIFCADRMYYFTYNMGLSSGRITLIMTLMTFSQAVLVPAVMRFSRRFDKRTLYIAGMGISAAGMGSFCFIGVDSLMPVVIFSVLYSIGGVCYWQLIPAMIYDVCEVDQLVNGRERAGLVISLQTLSESLANAAGLQMLGLILKFAGFDGAAAAQGHTAMFWINMCLSLIPAVFMTASLVMIVKYPVSKEMYLRILEALQKRRQGEAVDMSPFRKLK